MINRFRQNVRAFKVGTWLGWQIESNWTNPVLYVLFVVSRPLASALILALMYKVIARSGGSDDLFAYIFVGASVYALVGQLMEGMSWAVLEDRERMGMLKYISLAPSSLYAYLLGRGVAKVLGSLIAVPIILALGAVFFDLPVSWQSINLPMLTVALLLGIVMISFAGLILAGITMMVARHGGFLGMAVAGALFIFTGAIFPITVLPGWMQTIARGLPLTYWLEAMRRALLDGARGPGFESLGDGRLLLILAGLTLITALISLPLEAWAEHRAKEKGLLDMNTAY